MSLLSEYKQEYMFSVRELPNKRFLSIYHEVSTEVYTKRRQNESFIDFLKKRDGSSNR
jgi:hypothetical protein